MQKHLRRIKDHKTVLHYFGKGVQNDLIHLLENFIKQNISRAACHAKHYSIILDCSSDVSHNDN